MKGHPKMNLVLAVNRFVCYLSTQMRSILSISMCTPTLKNTFELTLKPFHNEMDYITLTLSGLYNNACLNKIEINYKL